MSEIDIDHLPTQLEQIGARQECICHKFIRLHDGNCPVHGFVLKQEAEPRPGERIQEFWCDECKEMHRGSVLGGPIGVPHGDK